MKKIAIGLAALALLFVLAVGGLLGYLRFGLPSVSEPPKLAVKGTEAERARGAYLAESVAVCVDCHSTRDWSRFSGPRVPGTEGRGGEDFHVGNGLYAPNITPAAIGHWSDGELYRALTAGVDADGAPLFPIMPYLEYGRMDPAEVSAIIAYIRTLPPIEHGVPETDLGFPLTLIVRTIPQDGEPQPTPAAGTGEEYGAYLAMTAACTHCHTPQDKGKPVAGMEYAGGFEMEYGDGQVIVAANVTPHPDTGIGAWTEDLFVARFKALAPPDGPFEVATPGANTIMPWSAYAGMTEDDLRAMYAYLKTLPAVDNAVTVRP